MTTRLWMAIGALLLVLGALVWAGETSQVRERIQQKVALGQSAREVRTTIGEPTKILKTQTYWTTTEDWVYGEGKDAIFLTFEEGKLKRISNGAGSNPK
ncbi:MAG: hypothetical protein ACM362_00135 [Candidatus Methylomirabilota bacterium]